MRTRREQPWPIRILHWANVPLLVIMAGSGLQILVAYPFLGPVGEHFAWYPFQGSNAPSWLRLGGWLAGARALHFAFGWFFVLNGLLYVTYLVGTGEWRRRWLHSPRDFAEAWKVALAYLRLGKSPSEHHLYNALQRVAYTTALALGAVLVLSGLAIYKPVQLELLADCFGGYDGARAVHLLATVAIAIFSIGHVVMVLVHPGALFTMLSGGRREGVAPNHSSP